MTDERWGLFLTKGSRIERDLHGRAQDRGQSFSSMLEEIKSREAETPYAGMSPWQMAEYRHRCRKSSLVPAPTAFEEVLAAQGFVLKGPRACRVKDFFDSSAGTVLFPEVLANAVFGGILSPRLNPQLLVGRQETITGRTYNKLYFPSEEDAESLRALAPGESIPTVELRVSDNTIKLKKLGRLLQVSYEALAEQRIDVVAEYFRRVGTRLSIHIVDELLRVAQNGDGNANTAFPVVASDTTGTMDYDDVLDMVLSVPEPFSPNATIGTKTMLSKYLQISEIKNSANQTQQDFMTNGMLPVVLGARAYKWDRAVLPDDVLVHFDTRQALALIGTGGIQIDAGKVMERQLNQFAVWTYLAVTMDDNRAGVVFDLTHT